MEAKVVQNFDDMQKIGKNNLEAAVQSYGTLAKSAVAIASEMAEYSKKSFEGGNKALEKLLGARTLEQAVEVQSEFAKAACEDFVAELTKISEHYADLAKETLKSFEPFVAKAASMK
jgi:hypothetical protein